MTGKIDNKFREEARRNYIELKSVMKTAVKLNSNYKRVARSVRDLIPNDYRKRGQTRYSLETRKKARKIYKKTGSIYTVSKITNVPIWTIFEWVKDLIPKFSNYGRYKYDKTEARKLYKKLKSTRKVGKIFGVSPSTVNMWAKDLVPIPRSKEEEIISKILDRNKIPYNKIRMKGYSHNYTPDFVIPPDKPKIIIESKTNNRKGYQQWHRVCSLNSKTMSFDVLDIKKLYPELLAIAIINKKWQNASMRTLNLNFDKVFLMSQPKEIVNFIKSNLKLNTYKSLNEQIEELVK